jgi:enoyl-CoA hydratase/carnithine racemase
VGGAIGRELFYTSRVITPEEALRHGIVNAVLEPHQLEQEAIRLAGCIAAQPPLAIRRSKALLWDAQSIGRDEHDARQSRVFAELAATADHAQAVELFLNGRSFDQPDEM